MKRLAVTPAFLLLAALLILPGGGDASGAIAARDPFGPVYDGYATILEARPVGDPPWKPPALPVFPNPPASIRLPVLMYHHLGEPAPNASDMTRRLTVSSARFEEQMSYLRQAGFETVSQEQLYNALFHGGSLPARPVMITIDDGFTDSYDVAAPILEKYGHRATFFVIAEKVGVPGYMGWDQIIDLEQRGMDIGSHTTSHVDLQLLDGAGLDRELGQSAHVIGQHLGHPVYWLCYPSGSFNAVTMQHAWQTGYYLGYTTEPGEVHSSDEPLRLSRRRVGPGTGIEEFSRLVD